MTPESKTDLAADFSDHPTLAAKMARRIFRARDVDRVEIRLTETELAAFLELALNLGAERQSASSGRDVERASHLEDPKKEAAAHTATVGDADTIAVLRAPWPINLDVDAELSPTVLALLSEGLLYREVLGQGSMRIGLMAAGRARMERAEWQSMYLGAFTVLGIGHLAMTESLAQETRTREEAEKVIARLREGREGDRVGPALQWLREQRKAVP
jgi:hypothetical protein